jgi:hypothetical protein
LPRGKSSVFIEQIWQSGKIVTKTICRHLGTKAADILVFIDCLFISLDQRRWVVA